MKFVPADPYAWPFDGDMTTANTALVVIDMQTDFCGKGGYIDLLGYDISLTRACIEPISRVLARMRSLGFHIIHTREGHRPDLRYCPPAKRARGRGTLTIGDKGPMGRILVDGEPGNDLVPELAALPGETVIVKPGKGAFYATPLGEHLHSRGIGHLVFAGVTTEVCVQTTMREANDRGYECLLAEDATESYFPEFKAATLAMIRAQGGIVGWTAATDVIVQAIQ